MATSKLFAVVVPLVIIFSSLQIVTSKHAISASPAGSPYVNAPNMSSFFPSQAPPQWPDSGAFGPIPSSGEFVGKSSCTSAKPDVAILLLVHEHENDGNVTNRQVFVESLSYPMLLGLK
ncbi:hypothetical protein Golax_021227, partial [Gossypium laxum]|nr:hypothetical protein [Gossypium laxum]